MNPSIWIYGGVHHDPGTRQKFLEQLAKRSTAAHFVAVECEKSVFEKFIQWRPWVEEQLGACWAFLTPQDCHELSLALAWEGDAYAKIFPDTVPLWLETGFQEANFKRRYGAHADEAPESFARSLLWRLCDPTTEELIGNVDPPKPESKKELIHRVWRRAWSEAWSEEGGFDRDARWAATICERSSGLQDGWIAVVVGWQHANSTGDNQRLRGLLLSKGFSVNSVRLGP